jgi:hypothetical protein
MDGRRLALSLSNGWTAVHGPWSVVRGLRSQDQRRQGVEPGQGGGQDTGGQGEDGRQNG